MLGQLLFIVFPVTVVLAGIGDMITMKISNRFFLALIAAFCIVAPFSIGWNPTLIASHLAASGIVLVLTFTLFAFGWLGGGDAKLAAGIALWLGLPHLLAFILLAAIFGGLLTLALLGFRTIPLPLTAARVSWIGRLHALEDGVPYGLALSAAALVIYPQTTWLSLLN